MVCKKHVDVSIMAAIVPAAGLGSRLLPFSKEVPKEMLPLIVRTDYHIIVEPGIFDSLYKAGFRKFYFIVGRGKRVIEDYFTPDWNYVDFLLKKGKIQFSKNV